MKFMHWNSDQLEYICSFKLIVNACVDLEIKTTSSPLYCISQTKDNLQDSGRKDFKCSEASMSAEIHHIGYEDYPMRTSQYPLRIVKSFSTTKRSAVKSYRSVESPER